MSSWNNFSVGVQEDGLQAISDELPACGSCRRRKLRCSREHPACSHCERLGIACVYEPRQKPGLKAGAVEALARRVSFLEQILLDGSGQIRPQFDPGNAIGAVSRETAPLTESSLSHNHDQASSSANFNFSEPTVARTTNEASGANSREHPTRKRKLDQPGGVSLLDIELADIFDYLPSQPLLIKLVDYFCVTFHHWIPYLHKKRLQTKVHHLTRDPQLSLVLHALVAATLRHLDQDVSFMGKDEIYHQTRISRFIAETFALKNVSLESLRALIIIVFDYLNDGQSKKAWPLIGSLTRTVDYLQLTVEPTASPLGSLMNPLKLVEPTDDWTELEERRRLFWVIFLLDRFCSVSTGWNTSLTSEDVHRRLPADGGYFTREEPVMTPYFGIWNKSSARIGRSLAHVPAQYNDEDPAAVGDQPQGTSPGSANGVIDSSKLGAFAYCIEATESLSQVTTFFLQQRINWQDKEHAVNWLTRFKELDLRLVHWKLFLPPRWKDSNISPVTEVVDMDPNLTLAHITHNTSMILLHFPIAYPPKEWNAYIALPKECSAQTCELAAVETCNIVNKFLTHRVVFVNVQFAFCAFVAAKALLFESQSTRKPIRQEFRMLIRSLWEISARWRPESTNSEDSRLFNQAGIYARHLECLGDACQRDPRFRFDLYDHSCRIQETETITSPTTRTTPSQTGETPSHDRWPQMPPPRPASALHHQLPSISNSSPNMPNLASILYNNTTQPQSPNPAQPHHHHHHHHQPPSPALPTSTYTTIPPPPPHTHPGPGPHPSSIYNGPLKSSPNIQPPHPTHLRTSSTTSASAPPPNPNPANSGTQTTLQDASLLSLSDALMDSQFLGLDRVITFEEGNFYLPGDGVRWS